MEQKVVNPTGMDENSIKCKVRESIFHLVKDYENTEKKQNPREGIVLFTGNKMNKCKHYLMNQPMLLIYPERWDVADTVIRR